MQYEISENKIVEFRLIDDEELPPIVITVGENDEPKVIINNKYKIWLSLNRKIIGGVAEALYGKIDEILNAHLNEQRMYERMED